MKGIKSELDCLVCMLRQGLNTARLATDDTEKQREILNLIAKEIENVNLEFPPALISMRVYKIIEEVTGVKDPFKNLKQESNEEALSMLPQLELFTSSSNDPLYSALLIAVAGNVIDFGIGQPFQLKNEIEKIINSKFEIDDYNLFKIDLERGKNILYLGDNAGEIVFDKVLINELLKKGVNIKFVVKSCPIINDATMEDAIFAGINELVPVIETGNNSIGIDLENSSEEFKKELLNGEIIISKGHGNFETLAGYPVNIYFLLKAKCDVVSRALGVKTGDIVFKKQKMEG
ncbi:MAG: damage-control phosphatase ARMT1 family protein [Candidatus Aminicenantia bacterium]